MRQLDHLCWDSWTIAEERVKRVSELELERPGTKQYLLELTAAVLEIKLVNIVAWEEKRFWVQAPYWWSIDSWWWLRVGGGNPPGFQVSAPEDGQTHEYKGSTDLPQWVSKTRKKRPQNWDGTGRWRVDLKWDGGRKAVHMIKIHCIKFSKNW